ncbi:hypothetical protein [Jiella pacifica]|uniref:Uncharacterized protein n=1 Tax=Jiella pacifica TaxID=2696469 RepID=A0A6N9T894_9HYPH|nr:hypothetical protein [Jiella pacifica]NDW07623.1 hypothetical protein [Jiella pacifica]
MNRALKEAIDAEIERSHHSGMALVLGDSAKRVVSSIGGSGEVMYALVERGLLSEASRRCMPVMLGHPIQETVKEKQEIHSG